MFNHTGCYWTCIFTSFLRRKALWNLLRKLYFLDKDWIFDNKENETKVQNLSKGFNNRTSIGARSRLSTIDGKVVPTTDWLEKKTLIPLCSAVPSPKKVVLNTGMRIFGFFLIGWISPISTMYRNEFSVRSLIMAQVSLLWNTQRTKNHTELHSYTLSSILINLSSISKRISSGRGNK